MIIFVLQAVFTVIYNHLILVFNPQKLSVSHFLVKREKSAKSLEWILKISKKDNLAAGAQSLSSSREKTLQCVAPMHD